MKQRSRSSIHRWRGRALALVAALVLAALAVPPAARAAGEAVPLPRFRDPAVRTAKPDLGSRRLIRFVTSSDWPPFQYLAADGSPVGFHVDLARAICAALDLSCTLQALPWDELLDTLASGRADAVIAGMRPSAELEKRADLTAPYFRLPARFASRTDHGLTTALPESLAGKTLGVVSGTAHEAYLKAFFAGSTIRHFAKPDEALAALKGGQIDAVFGDSVTLALWVGGTESGGCCKLLGGPFLESRYFGAGLSVAVKSGDPRLKAAVEYALDELEAKGTLAELYLRWFPIGIF